MTARAAVPGLSHRARALWQFSLAVYGQAGVPAACLLLQDRHGADVNVLLYAGWRASQGEALSEAGCRSAIARSAKWRDELVFPLRALRRRAGDLARENPSFGQAYASLKACELQLERQQQAMLADGSDQDCSASADVKTALDVFAKSMSIQPDPAVRSALAVIADAMAAVTC